MKNLLIFVILALPLSCPDSVFACAKKVVPKTASGLNVPFDVEAQAIHWTGSHNLAEIITGIKKAKFKKSQYETSEAYADRTRDVTLLGSIKTDSTLAFKFSTNDSRPSCYSTYNADEQGITLHCSFLRAASFYVKDEPRPIRNFTFASVTALDNRSYTGVNAYGVQKTITARRGRGLGLSIRNLTAVTTGLDENSSRELALTALNIAPDDARKMINDVGLLFIGNMEKPFFLEDTEYHSATLDSPVEIQIENQYVNIFLRQIWLIDTKRNIVLRRFDNFQKPLD